MELEISIGSLSYVAFFSFVRAINSTNDTIHFSNSINNKLSVM